MPPHLVTSPTMPLLSHLHECTEGFLVRGGGYHRASEVHNHDSQSSQRLGVHSVDQFSVCYVCADSAGAGLTDAVRCGGVIVRGERHDQRCFAIVSLCDREKHKWSVNGICCSPACGRMICHSVPFTFPRCLCSAAPSFVGQSMPVYPCIDPTALRLHASTVCTPHACPPACLLMCRPPL